MQPYRTSHRVPFYGWLIMLVAAIGGGLLLGLGAYYVSRSFWFVFMAAAGLGMLCGGLMIAAMHVAKVRTRLIATLFAVLCGLIAYGSYRYFEYRIGFFKDIRDEFEEVYDEELPSDEVQDMVDLVLEHEVNRTGFFGYVELDAREGFTIQSSHSATSSTSTGSRIKGSFAWGYWVLELLAVVVVATLVSWIKVASPFSEESGTWFPKAKQLGTLDPANVQQFHQFASQGSFDQAAALIKPGQAALLNSIVVEIRQCSNPDAAVLLDVSRVSGKDGKDRRIFTRGLIPSTALYSINAAIEKNVNPPEAVS